MRNVVELLNVLKDNIPLFFGNYDGLCTLTMNLNLCGIINDHEENFLLDYISINAPFVEYSSYNQLYFGWIWKPGEITPRVNWINERLKIESNESDNTI